MKVTLPLLQVEDDILKTFYHVSREYLELYEELRSAKTCIPGCFLVLVLFLQRLGTRIRNLENNVRKHRELQLTDFVKNELQTLEDIFTESNVLLKVFSFIFHSDFDIEQSGVTIDEILRSGTLNIIPDDSSVVHCIQAGKRLVWEMGSPLPSTKAKMATTAHLPGERKVVVLSELIKQTLAKQSDTVKDADVSVHKSKSSFIYLLTSLNSIQISKCSDTTIITGPVKSSVKISRCKNLRVVILARRLIVQDCVHCTLMIYTPTPPIIGASCHNIILGPHNSNYYGLEKDMRRSKLEKNCLNMWDSPILMPSTSSKIVKILPPADFDLHCLPFSSFIPVPFVKLPTAFETSLAERQKMVDNWESMKISAQLTPDENEVLEKLVKKEFSNYLENYSDEILGLKSLAYALESKRNIQVIDEFDSDNQ